VVALVYVDGDAEELSWAELEDTVLRTLRLRGRGGWRAAPICPPFDLHTRGEPGFDQRSTGLLLPPGR